VTSIQYVESHLLASHKSHWNKSGGYYCMNLAPKRLTTVIGMRSAG